MHSAAKALVDKGPGEHQFNVTVVPKDWGAAGDFEVYVNLSEYPHGPTWTPLAIDIQVLTFQQGVAAKPDHGLPLHGSSGTD